MIKLIQQEKYFSLDKIEDYTLNKFSLITGVNGSGKTQLLKAIDQGIIKVNGISYSEIVYYNYNDFNVVNGKISENEGLKSNEQHFKNKSEEFFQKLQHERQSILKSYKVWNNSLLVSEEFFTNGEIILESLDWSNEEIAFFDNYQKSNYLSTLSPQKGLLGGYLLQNRNINIKTWLIELKNALIKHNILTSLGNINLDFILSIDWENSEVDKYGLMENDFSPTIVGAYYAQGFNASFVNFVIAVNSNPILSQLEKQIGLIELKKYLLELSEDIKTYFKKNISKEYFDLAVKINGEENVCNLIQVNHGFLNLQDIAIEEKIYQQSKILNNYNQFLSAQGQIVSYYSDSEFLKVYGTSPVDMLNEVLNEYDCNGYEFKKSDIHIDLINGIEKQNISIQLYNKSQNYITSLENLSSGEKTLIALSFYLYKLRQNKAITRLLLLDEIDSALHPSMCKRLLDVLYNIFHIKMGINIIISTHSPSTVALAPNENIFLMDKDSNPKISNVSKDRALKELTIGVPSFSINYENRRQVFVESMYDVNFYENLYNTYSSELNSEISLNFISSGDSRSDKNGIPVSNCDQVIKITKTLRDYGNKSVWGIIDWDLKKQEPSEEYIKVLGFNKRYSIENYLLDPLLLAVLLWHERIISSKKFEFAEDKKYTDILNFDKSYFQIMIDKIVSDINEKYNNEDKNELLEYEILNSFTLQIPKWYCEIQGHELENFILLTYPELSRIRKKEPDLKNAIIEIVLQDFPYLLPIDLLDVFKNLQRD